MLQEGVQQQNQSKMAAGLQILYNMKQMETQVQSLITHMLDDLTKDIRHAVDMSSLQKQMRGNYIIYIIVIIIAILILYIVIYAIR